MRPFLLLVIPCFIVRGVDIRTVVSTEDTSHVAVSPTGSLLTGDAARKALAREAPGLPGDAGAVRQIAAAPDGQLAVAAANGLFHRDANGKWTALLPNAGARSWAPRDVRGVAFDASGRLWFCSPQGAGVRDASGRWTLYTGEDGLPYDDFTTMAVTPEGPVWFGTRRGAIRFDGRSWEYRQGPRWLPDDDVRAIATAPGGRAWFATAKGVSLIERKAVPLADKAAFFEAEIDKRHRRTEYQYVLGVSLKKPGDTSEWTQHDSDNDGLWTAMYGAGQCFAFAATGSPDARRRAVQAFEALRFLGQVTQGGANPAPPGFVARTVLPASGGDPNATHYTPDRDRQTQATRDSQWKIMSPRWPLSADGKWYWKSDTSSDELDGHFFFYALYYDLVAKTEAEREPVRKHVAAIGDHFLTHNFQYIDHDGKVTRWGVFNPELLNHSPNWWEERGINSLSILSYLRTAEHITGNRKYGEAAARLIAQHGYGANVLIPKANAGIGSGNQSDDEMIFMCFYNLVRFEPDPGLRAKFAFAFFRHWTLERPEMNPLFNFLYAHATKGMVFRDSFGPEDLTAQGDWQSDALETLERYPLDRINWPSANSQRKDIRLIAPGRGYRLNGKTIPVDERFVEHWNHDPWALDYRGDGRALADGASFLLPYYLGRYAGYVQE